MPRSKIAVLYVGGSIGMKVNQKTGRIEPIESLGEIHRLLPELQKEVSMEFFSMSNLGSSDITPDHWIEIGNTITNVYDRFDGFVVIHGTNTMAYTASALSFALQSLSKPVIFTGAILPINDIASDGRMNLVYALRAAQLDIAEVCIALGPRVLRATRAKKVDQSIERTFWSPKLEPLAEFGAEITLSPDRLVRRKRTLNSRCNFQSDVIQVTLQPGLHVRHLDALLASEPKGIILRSYGQGMISEELFPWLRRVAKKDIPVVITSQLLRGSVDLHRYRKQLTLEKIGIISGKNMTFECATAKLMWVLAQTKNPKRIRDLMEKSLVGELD